jgi:serine/threonine-protein phosphatase 6 regulatory subunit 3
MLSVAILQVLMRLVGADEQILMFHADAVQWLAETDLLEMLVEKLDPQVRNPFY